MVSIILLKKIMLMMIMINYQYIVGIVVLIVMLAMVAQGIVYWIKKRKMRNHDLKKVKRKKITQLISIHVMQENVMLIVQFNGKLADLTYIKN